MLVMEDRRKEVKAILCEELDNLRQRIIENHIRAGQRASGKTIKSLHVVVDDNHGTLYGQKIRMKKNVLGNILFSSKNHFH